MNRRQAIKTAFSATAVATVLRPWMLAAQEAPPKPAVVEGTTVNVDPATGADTNSGTKESPLRTLAEAARRVNQTDGTGPMTVILSEGVYAVGETATFKPERRSFTETDRLTIRAEVLPDDPDWHTGRMPTLIHTLPLTGPKARGPLTPEKQPVHYRVVNSLFAGNKKLTCSGTGAYLGFKDIDPSFLELINTKVSDESVAIELDETKKNYLHPVAGSEAAKIGVGLFLKPTE